MDIDVKFLFFISVVCGVFLFMAVFFVLLIYKNYKSRLQILEAVFKTQEEERNRIALDLHDEIGLGLNAIKFYTQSIKEEKTLENVSASVNENVNHIEVLVARTREIVRATSTSYVFANGIVTETLNLYARECERRNIEFNHEINLHGFAFDKNFQLNQFRICQELLHNAIKHSGCTQIDIKLIADTKILTFIYSDNGKGTEIVNSNINGIGIQNIKSRVDRYNGKTKFDSAPGSGFACTITYPVKNIKVKL